VVTGLGDASAPHVKQLPRSPHRALGLVKVLANVCLCTIPGPSTGMRTATPAQSLGADAIHQRYQQCMPMLMRPCALTARHHPGASNLPNLSPPMIVRTPLPLKPQGSNQRWATGRFRVIMCWFLAPSQHRSHQSPTYMLGLSRLGLS
jgi:hypothetical protein